MWMKLIDFYTVDFKCNGAIFFFISVKLIEFKLNNNHYAGWLFHSKYRVCRNIGFNSNAYI